MGHAVFHPGFQRQPETIHKIVKNTSESILTGQSSIKRSGAKPILYVHVQK